MKIQTSEHISLWDASTSENDFARQIDGNINTDLAIVGGGITGLSTALHTSEKGINCHVIEAKKIGYGGSGRNAGLVNAGMWLPPQNIEEKLGKERGRALIKQLSDAPEYVFSLIERYQIRCELSRSGTIHAAHALRGFEDLKRRADTWLSLGAPVQLLSRAQAAEKIGTKAFYGGLLDKRAGTINPMGYVRGLARAAAAAGASISTGILVQKLERHNNKWLLHTNKGIVTADTVVLGTNAYTDTLWPGLKKTFATINYFQLATKPMGNRIRKVLPGLQGLWDTGRIMFSLRRDVSNRLIIGSMGTILGEENGLSHRWAARTLKRLFPDLGHVEFDAAWYGKIAMTPDHLPRIHRLADGIYTPIGYNGRGITTGTIFGQAIAGLLLGKNESELPMPISEPRTYLTAPAITQIYELAFKANQWWKSF